MAVQSLQTPRFLRKTELRPNERNTNFVMTDRDVLEAVTSAEADRVTPLMSKIYNRLALANQDGICRERDRVLHFTGEGGEGKRATAWEQLCRYLRVSSETASKALSWMHEQGIIGYRPIKNGHGIWIFLNRAASSISVRAVQTEQKNLASGHTSLGGSHASEGEAASKDTYGVSEGADNSLSPSAPKSGADASGGGQKGSEPEPGTLRRELDEAQVFEIARLVGRELEPCVRGLAESAVARAVARENERTREWFERRAIPKAARVAQAETYNILRKAGGAGDRERRMRADLEVGREVELAGGGEAMPISPEGVLETAEMCVALYQAQGIAVDVTLAEVSSEGGGFLLPEDAVRVREAALALLLERGGGRS